MGFDLFIVSATFTNTLVAIGCDSEQTKSIMICKKQISRQFVLIFNNGYNHNNINLTCCFCVFKDKSEFNHFSHVMCLLCLLIYGKSNNLLMIYTAANKTLHDNYINDFTYF